MPEVGLYFPKTLKSVGQSIKKILHKNSNENIEITGYYRIDRTWKACEEAISNNLRRFCANGACIDWHTV